MKQLLTCYALLFTCWLLAPTGARAQERKPGEETLPPPTPLPSTELPPMPVPAAPELPPIGPACAACPAKTISVPRLTLMEQQSATTIPKMNLREEVVGKAYGLDVEFREEKQIVTEWSVKPREVIQEVPCTTMVPVKTTDPCTGECRTEYKSCPVVRQVKIIVNEPVPVQRVVTVSVPCLKPGNPLLVKKLAVDVTMEPAICTKMQLLTMPNEVYVPSCPPACLPPHP
ncbi:MAG TPA: hypothetical protein VH575_32265 [Gemmataceae bacterium]|jgi:hypothetical protein